MTAESTQKLYVGKIGILRNKYSIKDLNNYDEVISKIKDFSDTLIKCYMASIIWWNNNIKKNINTGEYQELNENTLKKYRKMMYNKTKTLQEIDESGKMTDKQKKKMILWQEVIKIRNKMLNEHPDSIDTLIIALYSFIPVRRLEYVNMLFIDKNHSKNFVGDDDKNYCVYTGRNIYFLINKFKMRYKMGNIKFRVNHALKNVIVNYVKKHNIKNEELLLGITQESNLSSKIKNIFKEQTDNDGFSVQILRHSYSSWLYINSANISQGDWRKISKLMGHSHKEHMNYSKHMDIEKLKDPNFNEEIKDVLNIKIY